MQGMPAESGALMQMCQGNIECELAVIEGMPAESGALMQMVQGNIECELAVFKGIVSVKGKLCVKANLLKVVR